MQTSLCRMLEQCRRRVGSAFAPSATLAVLFMVFTPASSLSAAPLQQEPAEPITLEPIEVSVLRTPFMSNDAPFAVAVKTEEDLRRGRAGVFLEDALQGMPGVQVQNRFNPAVGERIMIRGFGARAQFGLRDFRVIVDGIPATLADGQATIDHVDIGSLGRVEVLRGPASALFGNAGGGVIAFESRQASQLPYEVEVDAVGGSDGLMRGQVTASGTAGETGYLLSAYGLTSDGYREVPETSFLHDEIPEYGSYDRLGFNAQVMRPLAGGDISFTLNVLDLDAQNPGSVAASDPFGSPVAGGDPLDNDPFRGVWNTYLVFRTKKEVEQQQAGLRWAGPLGDFDGDFSVYGVHRTLYNPIPVDLVDLSRNGGGVRASLGRSYDMGGANLRWTAGGDVDLQDDDRKEFANEDGEPEALLLDQQETVLGTGAFLQLNLEFPSGIDLLGGLRYDRTKFEADDRFPVASDNPDDSGTLTMSQVSPSIGASVPLGGALNLFGSVGTLFETPTTSELSNQDISSGGFTEDLEPMTGVSYEGGVRGGLGSSAAFELTLYQTDLENELIAFEIAGRDGVNFFRNAGESRHRGFEGTLSLAGGGIFRGDVTFTHTDAEFIDYVVEDDGMDVNLAGNKVPGVSPNRLQALARIAPSLPFGDAFAEVVATYMDDVEVNDENSPSTAAPSYTVFDLRLGLRDVAVGGSVFEPWVAITNISDEKYIGSVAVNAFGGRFYEPGPPRSVQFGVRASFGGGN